MAPLKSIEAIQNYLYNPKVDIDTSMICCFIPLYKTLDEDLKPERIPLAILQYAGKSSYVNDKTKGLVHIQPENREIINLFGRSLIRKFLAFTGDDINVSKQTF